MSDEINFNKERKIMLWFRNRQYTELTDKYWT